MVKVLDYHVNNGLLKEMKKMEDLNWWFIKPNFLKFKILHWIDLLISNTLYFVVLLFANQLRLLLKFQIWKGECKTLLFWVDIHFQYPHMPNGAIFSILTCQTIQVNLSELLEEFELECKRAHYFD